MGCGQGRVGAWEVGLGCGVWGVGGLADNRRFPLQESPQQLIETVRSEEVNRDHLPSGEREAPFRQLIKRGCREIHEMQRDTRDAARCNEMQRDAARYEMRSLATHTSAAV